MAYNTNNDWYTQYSIPEADRPQPAAAAKPKQRRGVSAGALIACTLAAALAGAAAGGLFARSYADRAVETAMAESAAAVSAASSAEEAEQTAVLQQSAAAGGSFAQAASKAQIIELCAPTVVGIDVTVQQTTGYGFGFGGQQGIQEATGSGSGIILTSDGYIVTCNHVVEDATSITVILNDDTEYPATIVGTDARNDLAVIKIEATGLTPATLGDSDMLTVGEEVIAIGNPLGELRGTATSGIISAVSREVTVEDTDMTLLQTDAAISPGNSGGGLFNASGSLIGIVNAKASDADAEGLGFAIPVNSVKQIISDLMVHGYVRGRAYLGVYTQNVTLQSDYNGWGGSQYFGNYFGGGLSCVQVAQVVGGSAAEAAGLEVGDLILAVDDTEITSNETLSEAIAAYNAGDTAMLTIQRDGEELQLSVSFGEYSPAVGS
ncbi:MAG: trypsin-like peptidase domain-containing protein [Clostridia bacterium]|nr:trypsin-like peptidase domain-containing protein [Clostridia bacterium]